MRTRVVFLLYFYAICILGLMTATAPMAAQYPQPGPERVYAIKAGNLSTRKKGDGGESNHSSARKKD